jgi:hypothetical protein
MAQSYTDIGIRQAGRNQAGLVIPETARATAAGGRWVRGSACHAEKATSEEELRWLSGIYKLAREALNA